MGQVGCARNPTNKLLCYLILNHYFFLRFYSNWDVTGGGFKLEYYSVCSNTRQLFPNCTKCIDSRHKWPECLECVETGKAYPNCSTCINSKLQPPQCIECINTKQEFPTCSKCIHSHHQFPDCQECTNAHAIFPKSLSASTDTLGTTLNRYIFVLFPKLASSHRMARIH